MARARVLRASGQAAFLVLGGAAATQAPRYINFRTAFAEAPVPSKDALPEKKPIYSDPVALPTIPEPSPTSPVSKPKPSSPTPTDRLTEQVKRARLFLYDKSLAAENGINDFLTWAFQKETNFTSTIASLAPAPETGEQVLPGLIYVLVATMAGSIVTRNRGIVLRATFPLAVGVTAGWLLIPVTMRNTSDLIWEYEKRVPAIRDTHLQIRSFTEQAWQQAKIHADVASRWADEKTSETRKRMEELVSKGK
ncbi:hypothetical protein A1O1_00697 [Capronia coronata CBS 617.96]|uniref:MICOS complex subunit n=1 Tax=Capronia coronata CBS 617.96 TaxID=1182541 RepID=W9Z0V2_9EURO|nr:uncharacterized protein A1O1_00697 [Capronia coronata CBS 617.96]EXJ95575.1 hypothetical protein A1O1_00697 [Capronia coronata CBS 617.96]